MSPDEEESELIAVLSQTLRKIGLECMNLRALVGNIGIIIVVITFREIGLEWMRRRAFVGIVGVLFVLIGFRRLRGFARTRVVGTVPYIHGHGDP